MNAQIPLPYPATVWARVPRLRPRRRRQLALPFFWRQLDLIAPPPRPATRGDCAAARSEYPCCPWLTCRHHLWHKRADQFGELVDAPPDVWPQTCSLDVADAVSVAAIEAKASGVDVPSIGYVTRSGLRKRCVGVHLGLSGERARQLEVSGVAACRDSAIMAEVRGDVDCAVDWFGEP